LFSILFQIFSSCSFFLIPPFLSLLLISFFSLLFQIFSSFHLFLFPHFLSLLTSFFFLLFQVLSSFSSPNVFFHFSSLPFFFFHLSFLSSFAFFLINVLTHRHVSTEYEGDKTKSVPLTLITFKRNKMFIIIVLLMARKGCALLVSFLQKGVEVIIT
jgi:hypothetical protein